MRKAVASERNAHNQYRRLSGGSQRVWCVVYRDDQGRKCTRFVNAESDTDAAITAAVDRIERVFETDPRSGREIKVSP